MNLFFKASKFFLLSAACLEAGAVNVLKNTFFLSANANNILIQFQTSTKKEILLFKYRGKKDVICLVCLPGSQRSLAYLPVL